MGIQEATDFIGVVPHASVPDELRKLDVYVALSRSESFGVAVIEASACGLPVVVSNVGGLPEVVEQGVTGFIVPSEDPAAAADALEQLLASKELRERMGSAGRDRVERLYAWEACVDRQIAVLRSAIDRKHTKHEGHLPHAVLPTGDRWTTDPPVRNGEALQQEPACRPSLTVDAELGGGWRVEACVCDASGNAWMACR